MRNRYSINWGKWVRQPEQDQGIIEEMRRVTKLSKFLTLAAVVIIIISVFAGLLLTYLTGLKTTTKIDAAVMQMENVNKEFMRQIQNSINPNDFVFKPFEDSRWYTPTPVNEYVKLNILPVPDRKISFKFSIKNNSKFPAREVYCMILFSGKEFVESGVDIVRRLEGLGGLNVYTVNSSDDYLNQSAAFEWLSIPPNTQTTLARNVDLTMRGDSGRLTVKINSVNRFAFEFRRTAE